VDGCGNGGGLDGLLTGSFSLEAKGPDRPTDNNSQPIKYQRPILSQKTKIKRPILFSRGCSSDVFVLGYEVAPSSDLVMIHPFRSKL